MKSLLRRLHALEAVTAADVQSPRRWAEKEAEVHRLALGSMSAEDQELLKPVFSRGAIRGSEILDNNPAVFSRWTEAFNRACKVVPAPYPMTVFDWWL